MNADYRKPLPGTELDYFDARAAVNDIKPGAWDKLPYTSRVHAENIVRRADPAIIGQCLEQLIEVKREHDFPWYPARVVCHDILGQTALVDLAGLRDAIAEQGGDPAKVNPVVPVQLIVDTRSPSRATETTHRLSTRTARSRIAATRIVSISSTGPSSHSTTST